MKAIYVLLGAAVLCQLQGCTRAAKLPEPTPISPLVSLTELAQRYGELTGKTILLGPQIPEALVPLPPDGLAIADSCRYIRDSLDEHGVNLKDESSKYVSVSVKVSMSHPSFLAPAIATEMAKEDAQQRAEGDGKPAP